MPRLLLVDDNPSIHKIAETLLATSSIELVCVDSAAAALEKVDRGERFDVALLDTSMAGMDGWTLLARLREIPSTARMPIAMMAGVLDTVDPERIKEAPIQGFLKKPVELRELGDRIARLMEVSVPAPAPPIPSPRSASPFATMPATRIEDLPEFRQRQAPLVEDDLLELTEGDLYPESAEALPEPAEESLDLEELDLDNLKSLTVQPEKPRVPVPTPTAALQEGPDLAAPTPPEGSWPVEELDAVATLDRLPAPIAVETPGPVPGFAEVELPDLGAPSEELMDVSTLSSLPELEELVTIEETGPADIPLAELLAEPRGEVSFTPPLPPLEESLDWSDDSESMLAAVEAFPATGTVAALSPLEEELDLLEVLVPDAASVASNTLQLELPEAAPVVEAIPAEARPVPEVQEYMALPVEESTEAIIESALLESSEIPAVEPVAVPAPLPSAESKALLDAMMADPAMMDALAKAVVARLGDQALREIAWEVIPELAERLPRT